MIQSHTRRRGMLAERRKIRGLADRRSKILCKIVSSVSRGTEERTTWAPKRFCPKPDRLSRETPPPRKRILVGPRDQIISLMRDLFEETFDSSPEESNTDSDLRILERTFDSGWNRTRTRIPDSEHSFDG